ncbi:MAG: alpha-ketoglutarate-dependent dioxygenase AlkB [Pseudomonadota bacterium]
MLPNLLPYDGEAFLVPSAVAEPDDVFARLASTVVWRQETASIMGRAVPLPRLTAWYGESAYQYSGISNAPQPWLPDLAAVRHVVEALSGVTFNCVLLNFYRDGRDSVAWHRDAEPALGPDPVIASVSLGATRRFAFRHRHRKDARIALELASGSCLVMGNGCQRNWLHTLPKTRRPVGPRINLTYRRIDQPAEATSPARSNSFRGAQNTLHNRSQTV